MWILCQWKLCFQRFLLLHQCLVCVFTNLLDHTFRWEEQKIPQRGCSLLPGAGCEGQKKLLSAPALPVLLLYQGLWKTPAGSYCWMGNCVGKCFHSLNNTRSRSPVGFCYSWSSPAQTEENICGAVNLCSWPSNDFCVCVCVFSVWICVLQIFDFSNSICHYINLYQ